MGDGDLNNDGTSDIQNNTRELLLANLLNQINTCTSIANSEFHAVTSGSDESTTDQNLQYRVLNEAAFDAAYNSQIIQMHIVKNNILMEIYLMQDLQE